MEFDLEPRQESLTIAGKAYILREASEGAACKYRNKAMAAARMADGKLVGMDGAADVEPLLVSLCLWEVTDKGERPVSLATVMGWPARVVKPLFARAKAMSALDEEEQETRETLEEKMAALQGKLALLDEANGHGSDPTRSWLGGMSSTSG